MRRRKRRKRTFSSSSRGRRCVRPPPRPRPRPGRGGRPSPLGAPPLPPPPSVGATCSSPSASRRSPGGSPDSMVRTRNACLDGQIGGSIFLNPQKSFKLIHIQPTNLPIQRCPLPCFPLALSPLFLATSGKEYKEVPQQQPATLLFISAIWRDLAPEEMCTYEFVSPPPPSLPIPVDFWRRFPTRQMAI